MRWTSGALVLALSLAAPRASAYTVGTPFTGSCHELISQTALRGARAASPAAAPLALATADDRALAADLPFAVSEDMGDLGAIALLLGVRDNDLKGVSPEDLDALAVVQNDPTTQSEHCLRGGADLEPMGTPNALSGCKTYILGRVNAALGYLTAGGTPDPGARVGLPVSLAVRGAVTVPLPGFYVAMGQAFHALQDGFSHSYRAPDGGVTEALDWLHLVDGHSDQGLYGPPHSSVLDQCFSLDTYRAARLAEAEEASQLLLLAALGPGDADGRLANAAAVLEQYLAYVPGCTAANGWCDAPERAYPVHLDNCSVRAPGTGGPGAASVAMLVALGLLARRRRRRTATCLGAALMTIGGPASAGEAEQEIPLCAPPAPPPPPPSRFGAYAAVGGSVDHTAMNFSLGGRFWINPGWLVGADVELNPWLSALGGGVRPGAFNVYATVIRRWPLALGAFGLRSSLHAGASMILFDLFGVPRYSTGVYIGANLLGIEWKVRRSLALVLDPADVALPVPQLSGTPFAYLQYRLTLGLQWGA